MLLASSHPHDNLCINVVGGRIVLRPMDRPCHRRLVTDAGVGARVAVRIGRVVRVVEDVVRRLALVGQTPPLKGGERLTTMCHRLQDRKMISNQT
jgi:hypothetical protein